MVAAKLSISVNLTTQLAKLSGENKAFIYQILGETQILSELLVRVIEYFSSNKSLDDHTG